ncbi:MAG: hypothetical protein HC901_02610 [Bdellovibrionaceae bacterium]|nr:hypothetical protein [Pseudobdellovibrionaceae bacterium]
MNTSDPQQKPTRQSCQLWVKNKNVMGNLYHQSFGGVCLSPLEGPQTFVSELQVHLSDSLEYHLYLADTSELLHVTVQELPVADSDGLFSYLITPIEVLN